MAQVDVDHNSAASRFEVRADGWNATLAYRLEGDRIVLVETLVPRELEGRGIGSALAKAGLDYARQQGLSVEPECAFVRSYIERHPEYQDLVAR